MRKIIIGIFFIIGGASGHLALVGTNSSVALAVVGVGFVIFGFLEIFNAKVEEEVVPSASQDQLCTVNDEKIVVYQKTHESLGVLTELGYGQKFKVNLATDYDRFYQVKIGSGQTGYILRTSRFSLVK